MQYLIMFHIWDCQMISKILRCLKWMYYLMLSLMIIFRGKYGSLHGHWNDIFSLSFFCLYLNSFFYSKFPIKFTYPWKDYNTLLIFANIIFLWYFFPHVVLKVCYHCAFFFQHGTPFCPWPWSLGTVRGAGSVQTRPRLPAEKEPCQTA